MGVFQTYDPHMLVDRKKALAARIAQQVQAGGPGNGTGAVGGGAPSMGVAFKPSTGSARADLSHQDMRGVGNIASSIFGKLGAGYGDTPASQLAGQLADGTSTAGLASAGGGSQAIVPLGNGQYYDPFLGQVAGTASAPTQGTAAQAATGPSQSAAPATPSAPTQQLDPAVQTAMQSQPLQQMVGLPQGALTQAWINYHFGNQ